MKWPQMCPGSMGSQRAVLVVLLLLLAAVVAVAQSPFGPPEYEVWNDANAECWKCHKPGAYDPDMDPFLVILPSDTTFSAGDAFELETSLKSVWQSDQGDYTLSDFRITMDITNATSLAFVSDEEPIDETVPGTVPIDPTAIFADPSTPVADPTYLTREHGGHVVLQVPAGATDITFTLMPTDTSAVTGPDLSLKLHPNTAEPGDAPAFVIDGAGRGLPERFRADTPAELGALGGGNLSVEATLIPLNTNEPGPPPVGPVGFTVQMQAWFNASANVKQVLTSSDVIAPNQQTLIAWRLTALTDPAPGESIRFAVNLTTFYEHDGGDESQNWSDLTYFQTIPLTAVDDGFVIGSADGPIIVPQEPSAVSLAAISEAIGYIGGILLIVSIVSGGMFGKATRRWQNRIFGAARRRVAFHNFLSYGLTAFALAHMFIFIWDLPGALSGDGYHWLVGVLLGGPAILAMLLLGVTGAIQVPMIRRWNYGTWRWTHFWLAIAALAFTVAHLLLDGANFGFIRDAIGYQDPLVPDEFEI